MLATAAGISKDAESTRSLVMFAVAMLAMAIARLTYREKHAVASIRTRTFIVDKSAAHAVDRFVSFGCVTAVVDISESFVYRIHRVVRIVAVEHTVALCYISRIIQDLIILKGCN